MEREFLKSGHEFLSCEVRRSKQKGIFLKRKSTGGTCGRNAAVCCISGGGRADSAVSDGDHCLSAGRAENGSGRSRTVL